MLKKMMLTGLVLFSVYSLGGNVAEAERMTLTATGFHIMGDDDSPQLARDEARNEAKRAVTEKAGTYIESYSVVNNATLTTDEIKMISANVVKIIDEQESRTMEGNSMKVSLTITAEVDTDGIDLQSIMQERTKDSAAHSELIRLQKENEALQRQLQNMSQNLAGTKTGEITPQNHNNIFMPATSTGTVTKSAMEQQIIAGYQVSDMLERCSQYMYNKDFESALTTINKVIAVTGNSRAYPHYLRGVANYRLGNYDDAIHDFNQADRTPGSEKTWKSHYYRAKIYDKQGLLDEALKEISIAERMNTDGDNDIRLTADILRSKSNKRISVPVSSFDKTKPIYGYGQSEDYDYNPQTHRSGQLGSQHGGQLHSQRSHQ